MTTFGAEATFEGVTCLHGIGGGGWTVEPLVMSPVTSRLVMAHAGVVSGQRLAATPTLEATQGQMNSFVSQLPYKCYQNQVASVRD